MDILTGLAYGVGLYVSFKLGQFTILTAVKRDVRERLLRGEISAKDVVKSTVDLDQALDETVIDIEQHQGCYYAFADSGEFLAQGKDFDSMFGAMKQRFPGRNFRVPQVPKDLSEEQAGQMVKAIFKTFGDKHEQKG